MSSIDKLIKDNEDKILQFEEEFKKTNSEEEKKNLNILIKNTQEFIINLYKVKNNDQKNDIKNEKKENNLSQEKENKKKNNNIKNLSKNIYSEKAIIKNKIPKNKKRKAKSSDDSIKKKRK